MLLPDFQITPAFLRQRSVQKGATTQKETTSPTVNLADSRADANAASNDQKESAQPEDVVAPEANGRDQEMQGLREANATLTQRLAQMAEMIETRSEAPPPSYFSDAI